MTAPSPVPAPARFKYAVVDVAVALAPPLFIVALIFGVIFFIDRDLDNEKAQHAAEQAKAQARDDAVERDVLKFLAAEGRKAQSADCFNNECTVIIDSAPYTVLVQDGPKGEPVYAVTDYQG